MKKLLFVGLATLGFVLNSANASGLSSFKKLRVPRDAKNIELVSLLRGPVQNGYETIRDNNCDAEDPSASPCMDQIVPKMEDGLILIVSYESAGERIEVPFSFTMRLLSQEKDAVSKNPELLQVGSANRALIGRLLQTEELTGLNLSDSNRLILISPRY